MYEEDANLLKNFHTLAGHSKNSIKSYTTAFNKYRSFHAMSLTSLLAEAIEDQKNNVPENELRIYNRINSFKNYLIKNHTGNTITTTLPKIKTFYKYNRVKLPFIPPVNRKNIRQNDFISFDDLLTKSEIIKGLSIANDITQNWILVMVSSGVSLREAKSMTNRTLFEGTCSYHHKNSFKKALKVLSKMDNVVCTCKLVRQKTNKPYYTFLSPECVQTIASNKLKNNDFELDDPLLKYNVDYIQKRCREINEHFSFGYAGGYTRFRPHMFRKFNATYLNQGYLDNNISMEFVDSLQGRGKGLTRDAYFKNNPEVLKLNYVKVLNNISLYNKYDFSINDGELSICRVGK